MMKLTLTGTDLTLKTLAEFDETQPQTVLADSAREQMQKSVDTVQHVVETGQVCYGINTGFGALAREHIIPRSAHPAAIQPGAQPCLRRG